MLKSIAPISRSHQTLLERQPITLRICVCAEVPADHRRWTYSRLPLFSNVTRARKVVFLLVNVGRGLKRNSYFVKPFLVFALSLKLLCLYLNFCFLLFHDFKRRFWKHAIIMFPWYFSLTSRMLISWALSYQSECAGPCQTWRPSLTSGIQAQSFLLRTSVTTGRVLELALRCQFC